MTNYKLTYFDFAGSRGEECRLALALAGVSFDDERLDRPAWAERKGSTPFGALPTLEISGKGLLPESNAILVYLGREHGLHPKDNWEAARHEAVMCSVEDLRARLNPTARIEDPDKKKAAREEFAAGYLRTWSATLQRYIGDGPYLAGKQISVADVKVFVILRSFMTGNFDHIGPSAFAEYPAITRLYEAVGAHPKVAAWYAKST